MAQHSLTIKDSNALLDGVDLSNLAKVQNLITELKIVEANIKNQRSTGKEHVQEHLRRSLDEFIPLDFDTLLAGWVDGGRLALPSKKQEILQYPADCTDLVELKDPKLIQNSYTLLNQVKAIINDEAMKKNTSALFEDTNLTTCSATRKKASGRTITRKKSYTLERNVDCETFLSSIPNASNPMKMIATSNGAYSSYIVEENASNTQVTTNQEHFRTPISNEKQYVDENAECTFECNNSNSYNTYSKKKSPFGIRKETYSEDSPKDHFSNPNLYTSTPINSPRPRIVATMPSYTIDDGGSRREHELNSTLEKHQQLMSGRRRVIRDTELPDFPKRSSFDQRYVDASMTIATPNSTMNGKFRSNPPSDTSSGISSPPNGSFEDVQCDELRRSMPNLYSKQLTLPPQNNELQRNSFYQSDEGFPKVSRIHSGQQRFLRKYTEDIPEANHKFRQLDPTRNVQGTGNNPNYGTYKKQVTRGNTFDMSNGHNQNEQYHEERFNGHNLAQISRAPMSYGTAQKFGFHSSNAPRSGIPGPKRMSIHSPRKSEGIQQHRSEY